MHNLTSQQRYQLLAQHAFEHAFILLDDVGIIVEWSPGAEKLLGWSAQEAIGQPGTMLFTPEDRAAGAPQAELETARTLGRAADIRWHLRKDGTRVFIDGGVTLIPGEDGMKVRGFGKIMRDAFRPAPQPVSGSAVAASEQRSFLAAILESIENAIVACDAQGRLTFFNDATRRLHGLPEEPLPPEQWAHHYRLYRPDGVTPLPIDEIPLYRALRGEQVKETEMVVATPDGARRTLLASGRPMQDGQGHILGAVVSMHDITAQRQAQEALALAEREQARREEAERMAQVLRIGDERLRLAEEQLRLATDAAQLGIWSWEVDADKAHWENERLWEMFGISRTADTVNVAQFLAEYIHPDDREPYQRAIEHSLKTGERYYFSGRFYRASNKAQRWFEVTGLLHEATDGTPRRMVGTAADITEKKLVEEALKEAHLRLEGTLSAAEVGSWIWDIPNDRITTDRNLTKLFGVPDALASGAPLARFHAAIHPEDQEDVTRQIQQALATGEPYRASYRVKNREGAYCWVNARGRAEYDEAGKPVKLVGVTLDVTRQVEAEHAWRASEDRYRTVINSMDDGFGVIELLFDEQSHPVDYRFLEINAAFETHTGLSNPIGKTVKELIPDIDAHWIEIYGRVALTGEPIRFINESVPLGRWFDVYATPIGELSERKVALLFNDITARKRDEEELRKLAADLSAANRRKTEFLATLAHELRNPLAPVRTGLDLMRMPGRKPEGSDRVLAMMDRQVNQLVHLIDDLMDISRINSGKIVLKKECIALQTVLNTAIEAVLPAIESAQHHLDVKVQHEPIMLDADATRLSQILTNLLTNAAKYTPNGGHIILSGWQENDAIVLSVADSGIGIPEDELGEVFEMFSQVSKNMGRAQGGLGIGLSLVRSLVEMHGGTITASSPGEG